MPYHCSTPPGESSIHPVIEHHKSLKALNTFGFDQQAERYAEAPDEGTLLALLDEAERAAWPVLVLGGGSNVVLTRDVPGLVIRLTERRTTTSSGPARGSTLITGRRGRRPGTRS